MEQFAGRTAVITGAASGIGYALARLCAAEGMAVALADLPGERLDNAERELREGGASVRAYGVDVGDPAAVRRLATEVRDAFGAIHLLCNNAGIAGLHRWSWTFGDAEWDAILAVNLRGVINGVNAFLPAMIEQDEGHIVNTASMAGLVATPMNGAYVATKFGVVGLSETLSIDLAAYGSRVGVSVLCPGLVRTGIGEGITVPALAALDERQRATNAAVKQGLAAGMDPAQAARSVLEAVHARRFYVLTHPEGLRLVETRMRAIRDGGQPSFPS